MRLRWALATLLVTHGLGAAVADRLPALTGLARLRLVVVPGDSPLGAPLAATLSAGLDRPVALTAAPLRPGDAWAPGVLDEWLAKVPGELLLLDASQTDPSWPASVLAARLAAAIAAAPRTAVLAVVPPALAPALRAWLPDQVLVAAGDTPAATVQAWLQPVAPPLELALDWSPQPTPGELRLRAGGEVPPGSRLRWPGSGLPEVPLSGAAVLLPTPYPTPWLDATLHCGERSWPWRLAVPVDGLHVWPALGRSVDGLRVGLRELAGRARRVVLQGRETLTVDLPAGASREVLLPLAVPSVGCGPRLWPVGVSSGEATWQLLVPASYAAGAAWAVGGAQLDGRLDDWRGAAWHTVGLPTQLVDGAAGWQHDADLRLRWAVRREGADLLLAVAVSDDQVTVGDRLLLAWDARPVVSVGQPGPLRRLSVPLTAALADPAVSLVRSGEGAVRYLELRLLGAVPVDCARLGFDLGYRDDDPPAVPSEHRWSGDRWTDCDPARLPLLASGEAVPSRLFVELADPAA
ncbi:MAG: hypothetical protein IT204_21990 [Fimbriimonadaceae bacterium]|nr:hypothetical protein [Fimbriimonadaceae bacterium]